MVNVNLGAPYEAAIKRIIERGYAGNQTEVIRQAILAYEKLIREEDRLVAKAMAAELADIKSGKVKLIPFDDVKKGYGL
jgi:Arc/MetJ-type ribon-helix-helix transcriptional regulator